MTVDIEKYVRLFQGEPAEGGLSEAEAREEIQNLMKEWQIATAEKIGRFGGFCTNCKDRLVDILTQKEY